MKNVLIALMLNIFVSASIAATVVEPVIYWDSPAGIALRTHILPDADYWELIPTFAMQETQSYCSVASAITVLNAMPIKKPVDPTYTPYSYFTQHNYFTAEVMKIISPQTVLAMGMTREQMTETLIAQGVHAKSIAGDKLSEKELRTLLKHTLINDGQYVLANYLRGMLGQVGGGHWSVLAAYDVQSDRVLILDVAKYKYPPVWVSVSSLRQAISTLDTTSNQTRGLVIVSK
jgi:hypothetical protein